MKHQPQYLFRSKCPEVTEQLIGSIVTKWERPKERKEFHYDIERVKEHYRARTEQEERIGAIRIIKRSNLHCESSASFAERFNARNHYAY